MDYRSTIEDLNAQIEKLTSIRDGLVELSGDHATAKKKAHRSTITPEGRKRLAENMRKRWAEQKRKQRAAKRKVKRVRSPKASEGSAGQ